MKRLIVGFLAVALGFAAEAAELVWKGASGAKWSAAASWTPEQAPANGDTLVFDSASAAISADNDLAGLSVAEITVQGANAIALTGNALTLTGDFDGRALTGKATVSLAIAFGGTATAISAGEIGTAVGKTFNKASDGITSTGHIEFAGVLSGAAPITVDGAGSVTLSNAANAFTGNFLFKGNRLYATGQYALGSGTTGEIRFQPRNYAIYYDASNKDCSSATLTDVTIEKTIYGTLDDLNTTPSYYRFKGENTIDGDFINYAKTDFASSGAGAIRCNFTDGSTTTWNGGFIGISTFPTCGSGHGTCVFNCSKTPSFGVYRLCGTTTYVYKKPTYGTPVRHCGGPATVRFACDDALRASAAAGAYSCLDFNKTSTTVDLNGYDQHWTYICNGTHASAVITDTSAGAGATLHVLQTAGTDAGFAGVVSGTASLSVESATAGSFTLGGKCTSSGTLSATGGADLRLGANADWVGPIVVDASSTLTVPAGKTLTVPSMTLGGVACTRGVTYTAANSGGRILGDGAVFVGVPATLTWVGPSAGGDLAGDNWEPYSDLIAGDKLVIAASEDMTFSNSGAPALGGITLTGGKNVTFGGSTITLEAGSSVDVTDAAGASEVTFTAPLELAGGLVYFVSRGNGLTGTKTKGVTFNLNSAIGGAGGLSTGGNDYSGTYNFRGENTYAGVTYLTNGIAYHAYSDGAFGSTVGKTIYRASIYDCENRGLGEADDKIAPLYLHGIDSSENFDLDVAQSYSLTAVANTTNILRGAMNNLAFGSVVIRWHVLSKAELTFKGLVTVGDVACLHVDGTDARMRFEGGLTCNNTIRCAAVASSAIEFAGPVSALNVLTYATGGTLVIDSENPFGADGSSISDSFQFNVAHTVRLNANCAIRKVTASSGNATQSFTSENGSTLTLVGAVPTTFYPTFDGDLNTVISAGTPEFQRGLTSTGTTTLRSGVSATFGGAAYSLGAWTIDDGATLAVTRGAALPDVVDYTVNGMLTMGEGVNIRAKSLTAPGIVGEVGKTYGSTASAAEVTDNSHFGGTGVLTVTSGSITGIPREWTGGAGTLNLADATNWEPSGAPASGDTLTIPVGEGTEAVTYNTDLGAGVVLSGLVLTGTRPVTLAGTMPLAVYSNGDGLTVGAGQSVTVQSAVQFVDAYAKTFVIQPPAGAVLDFTGVISGDASILVTGDGTTKFRGANTFTGLLEVRDCSFYAYGSSPFGSSACKTVVTYTGGTGRLIVFSDATIDDDLEWKQTDGTGNCGTFWGDTVFNGTLTGTGGQPRWSIVSDARVTMNGAGSNLGAFTIATAQNSTFTVNAPLATSSFRLSGLGRNCLNADIVETSYGTYPITLDNASASITLGKADLFNVPAASQATVRYGTIDLDGGTIDLNGCSQQCGELVTTASSVITNSSATMATITSYQTIQTLTVNYSRGTAWTLKGPVRGAVSLAFDGTYAAASAKTQTLTAVSTSLGTLAAKNGMTVRIAEGATWSGDLDIDATSKITTANASALGRRGIVRVADGGTLVIPTGVTLRCRQVYLNGVLQPKCEYTSADGWIEGGGKLQTRRGAAFVVR